ncbi:MAG: hypothetical protein ACK46X_15575 [Candidatus Sericytochromatia bacterium]
MSKHPLVIKLSWALVVIGTLIWLMIPLIVFLPLGAPAKAAWAGGAFIASEIIFWAGALVIGPTASKRLWAGFKARLSPRT